MAETDAQRRARQAKERAEAKKQALGVSSLVYSPTLEAEKLKAQVGDLTSKERAQKLTSGDITKEQFQASAGKISASSPMGVSAINLTDTQRTAQERMAQAKGDTIKTLGDVQYSATQRKQDTLATQQAGAQQIGQTLADAYTSGGEKALRNEILAQYPQKEGETMQAYNQRVGNITTAAKSRADKAVTGKITETGLTPASETNFPTVADYTNEETGEVDWQGLYQAQVGAETQKKQTEGEEIMAARITDQVDFGVPTEEEIRQTSDYLEKKTYQDDQIAAMSTALDLEEQRQKAAAAQAEAALNERIKTEEEMLRDEIAAAKVGGYSDSMIKAIQSTGEKDIKALYKNLDELRDSNNLTIAQIVNDNERLKQQGQYQASEYLDTYVSNVQTQYQEANQAAYDRQWEQYKYQQEQNWKAYEAMPEMFNLETINGQVQAIAKPVVERQAAQIAAQFGQSMDYIQQVKDTFGDSTIGQGIIMYELSKYGIEATPEMIFPEDKKTLEDQLALVSKFSSLPPEALQNLAMGGQIFGMELDEQERATVMAIAQGQQAASQTEWNSFVREEMFKAGLDTPNYQTFKGSDGIDYIFDPRTGQTKMLTGGNVDNNASTNAKNISKLSETSNVSATVDANEVFTFGDATTRTNGNQCGGYVNDVLGIASFMGDSYESKIKNVPKDSQSSTGYNMQPIAGGFFVMDAGTTGHTGMVRSVVYDDSGNIQAVNVTDYNWVGAGQRGDYTIQVGDENWQKIKGFGSPNVKSIDDVYTKTTMIDRLFGAERQAKDITITPQVFDIGTQSQKYSDQELSDFAFKYNSATPTEQGKISDQLIATGQVNDFKKILQEGEYKLTGQERISAETGLRKEFTSNVKDARKTLTQLSIMDESLKKAEEQIEKGGDINSVSQGILVTFQKVLDPTSVVRESEYARSGEGQAFLTSLEGKIQQIKQGGAGVTIESLRDFVDTAHRFQSGYQDYIASQASVVRLNAQANGLRENLVLDEDTIRFLNDYEKSQQKTVKLPSGQKVQIKESINNEIGDLIDQYGEQYDIPSFFEALINEGYSPSEALNQIKLQI